MTRLYHRNIFWTNLFDEQSMDLIASANKLSKHLESDLDNPRKKHEIDIRKLFLIIRALQNTDVITPYEVETEDFIVMKCVVRCPYDETRDISIVFRQNLIVTAWLNNKEDVHNTLNHKRYSIKF